MSPNFHLSLSNLSLCSKGLCPKTLDGTCDFYDEWEPEKQCLINNGLNCKRVKA